MPTAIINQSYPDKKAIISAQGEITYNQLFGHIEQYAGLFSNKGYERVAIYAENSPFWVYAFYAALQNQNIAIPIDFMASNEDVAYILDDCKPNLVFVSRATQMQYLQIAKNIDYKPEVLVLEDCFDDKYMAKGRWEGIVNNENTATIIYTSGTTGSPKGVMLSYTNILQNTNAVIDSKIFEPDRQVMIFLPLHHVFPLVGSMMAAFCVGATVPMVPSMQTADLMQTFASNQVGVFIGVPRLYEIMYRGIKAKIDQGFVSRILLTLVLKTKCRKLGKLIFNKVHQSFGGHLRYLIAGGAALDKEVGAFFYGIGFEMMEGYGMTEAAPMITFPRPGKIVIGSPGQALPGLTIEIRDGEIVAKGPNIMKGYYNRPEETAEILKDGWLYTGDLGYIDRKGYLFITGRKKETIVLSNGKNINPSEIETKLNLFSPAIKESGVLMHNDLLHALILPDPGFISTRGITNLRQYFRDSIITPFNATMSPYKHIMQFTLVNNELPRTRLSKLQRYKFEELITQKTQSKVRIDEPNSDEYLAIKTFVEEQTGIDVLPDHHLIFDLALDSLGKLNLIDFVEKSFGVKISDEQISQFASVREMTAYIDEHKQFYKIVHDLDWASKHNDKNVILPKSSFLMRLIVNMVRGVFKLFFSFEAKGMENIPEGPCFFAPNHESKLDAFLVLSYLDKNTMKNTYSYAKKDHVNSKARRYLASRSNVIVIDTTEGTKQSIIKLAEVARQGKKVLIFPEGTRTTTGQLGQFKKTYAILSTELNIPVVPIVIDGAFAAMSSGKRKIKWGEHISIEFLPPDYPEGMSADDLNEIVKQKIIAAKLLKQ